MSAHSSAGSADSTTDSAGLGFDTRSSVKAILGGEGCSESGSPECLSTTTYEAWDEYNQVWDLTVTPPLTDARAHQQWISFAAVSPAKTSQSPDAAPDSPEANDRPSSSSSPAVQTSLFQPEGGSSSRTYPDYFPATTDEISPSYSRRWPSSGFTTSPGECWTADTSECPNGGGVSSSLADVLQDGVPSRYFLSPKAAAGILRRAEKRGRELPAHLAAALEAVAGRRTPSE
jgi:hypothetical protein